MKNSGHQIEIYQSADGRTQVEVKFDQETVWLNQKQMGELFDKDSDTIGLHLKNIFTDGELEEQATTEDFSVVQIEGNRKVRRRIKFYNLDAIISVGYRVNSMRGTQFRQWATQRLRDFLVQGYAINEKRLAQTQKELKHLKTGFQILSRTIEEQAQDGNAAWLQQFSKGLKLLDDYDYQRLDEKGLTTRKPSYPRLSEYRELIVRMKISAGTDIFGQEKDQSFESSIAQINQGLDQNDFYPSLEEKAATLLYLIIKNHAFIDGNKRIAAASFLLFLERNHLLYNATGEPIISNEALASLTLFIAASKPDEMEIVKNLVVSVLNRNQ